MKDDTTRSIVQIKAGISVQKWEEQIRACQESGKKVKEWCKENGIPVGTYYSRLRRIRETALTEEQQAFTQTAKRSEGIHITSGEISVSLPEGASPEQLAAIVRALKSC